MNDVSPELEEFHSDSYSVSSADVPSVSSSTMTNDTQSLASESENEERVEGEKPVSFSVQGIYSKYYVTPEEGAERERQNLCLRYRMYTRPFENPSNDDSTDKKEDDADSREEGEDEEDDEEEYEYETAMFVPKIGLVGAEFWHIYDSSAKVVREDRAILFQSQENYECLLSHDELKSCFEDIDYMEYPTFGEQVIVNGIAVSDLAIGDVFEIEGGHSPLVVEITAPRKPCSYMNLKHGTGNGAKGIQTYAHHNMLAGWFARVLVAGELLEGMKFIRKAHPNPKWTLGYIYKALYYEGTSLESGMNISSWNRDRKELEELIALPQLGEYEWKVEGRKRLYKLDGIDWKTVRRGMLDPQTLAPNFILEFFRVAEILKFLITALKNFGIL